MASIKYALVKVREVKVFKEGIVRESERGERDGFDQL